MHPMQCVLNPVLNALNPVQSALKRVQCGLHGAQSSVPPQQFALIGLPDGLHHAHGALRHPRNLHPA